MRTVGKLLALGALLVTARVVIPRLRGGRHASAPRTAAAAMFVGAVDEVELGGGLARPMRGDVSPEGYDPEEVPSEHSEINELRNQMPFG